MDKWAAGREVKVFIQEYSQGVNQVPLAKVVFIIKHAGSAYYRLGICPYENALTPKCII